jgi:ATP-binding cassette, subfamily F, member 3
MSIVRLTDVTREVGTFAILDAVSGAIALGDRIGLVGPNGAGKTTLLRIVAGVDEPDRGAVARKRRLSVGLLAQEAHLDETFMAAPDLRTAVRAGAAHLETMAAELASLEAEGRVTDPAYADLQHQYDVLGGYTLDLRVDAALSGLGFTRAEWAKPPSGLSGGEQTRAALARLVIAEPDLMLLDEPTNHLDLEARNWLETYLNEYPHAVILVSHDRFFLDAVVTRIADLTLRTLTDYHTNYSGYLAEHRERIEAMRKAKREQDEEVARVKMFIDRFRYQATKAAQVQSRIKQLEKVVPIEVPPERKKISFHFPACAKSGRMVIELKRARKAYGDLTVFTGLDLHIARGDRIALVGPNGAGKSTLMRMLSGEEAPDDGERVLGHNLVMQYFAQDEATRMDPAPTVYETLSSGSPLHMVPMIRNILGGFLFSGDDVYKHVRVLSGGERTRLAVARMLLRPSNTLLLDEPTNHLDLDSKEVLLDALVDYGGTLMFVSHDRYFVERLATKIIEVGDGTATSFPGTYREFLYHKEHGGSDRHDGREPQPERALRDGHREPKKSPLHGKATQSSPQTKSSHAAHQQARGAAAAKQQSREEKKKADAESRKRSRELQARQARIESLEARIAETESAIREVEQQMSTPGFYDDRVAAQPVIDRHQSLMWQVGDLMHQWEELQSLSDLSTEV